jgi:hypothetical protein
MKYSKAEIEQIEAFKAQTREKENLAIPVLD